MSMSMHLLASGPGWRAEDALCSAGPRDRPFEEQHGTVCVAAVTRGTFQYRSPDGRATLVPGALMLGNPGACFECGHEHGVGDRCLSFHFDPEFFEEIVASVPGTRRRGKRRRSNPRRRRPCRSRKPQRRQSILLHVRTGCRSGAQGARSGRSALRFDHRGQKGNRC